MRTAQLLVDPRGAPIFSFRVVIFTVVNSLKFGWAKGPGLWGLMSNASLESEHVKTSEKKQNAVVSDAGRITVSHAYVPTERSVPAVSVCPQIVPG